MSVIQLTQSPRTVEDENSLLGAAVEWASDASRQCTRLGESIALLDWLEVKSGLQSLGETASFIRRALPPSRTALGDSVENVKRELEATAELMDVIVTEAVVTGVPLRLVCSMTVYRRLLSRRKGELMTRARALMTELER